jgi:hypothetical protein
MGVAVLMPGRRAGPSLFELIPCLVDDGRGPDYQPIFEAGAGCKSIVSAPAFSLDPTAERKPPA